MKTLTDVLNYAREKGMAEKNIARLADETASEITDIEYNNIILGIDSEREEWKMFRNLIYLIVAISLTGLCLYAIYDYIMLEHETWRNVITCMISLISSCLLYNELDFSDRSWE